jgi:NADH:ubiquinone oxidoreductase subunit E
MLRNVKGVARHLRVCLRNVKGVARHLRVCLRNVKGVARHLRVCMQVTCADAYGAMPTTLQLTRSMSTDINTPDCYTISVKMSNALSA